MSLACGGPLIFSLGSSTPRTKLQLENEQGVNLVGRILSQAGELSNASRQFNMSGAEVVAGLVLGAIPVLIAALEHYKSGKSIASAFFRIRKHVDTLIFRLKSQRQAFRINIMLLLRFAGIAEFKDGEEELCVKTLLEGNAGPEIRQFLGEAYETFEEVVKNYERCMKIIAGKIMNIRRTPKAEKDDLRAIMEANPGAKFSLGQRLDFTIDRGSLKVLLNDLKEDNLTLDFIVTRLKAFREAGIRAPSNEAGKLAEYLQRVQGLVGPLHTTLQSSWKPGCHPSHEVMFRLDDRINDESDTRPLHQEGRREEFAIILHVPSPTATAPSLPWHKFSVWVQGYAKPDDSPQKRPDQHPLQPIETRKRPTFDLPDLTAEGDSATTKLSANDVDICKIVHQAGEKRKIVVLQLNPDVPRLAQDDTSEATCVEYITVSTLESRLVNAQSIEETLLPLERTALALSLASSVLQLQGTDWLTKPWTKRSIYFPATEPHGAKIHEAQPVILLPIDGGPRNVTKIATSSPLSVLLELTILLLEIWHYTPLERWAREKELLFDESEKSRRDIAEQWFRATSRMLPRLYCDAVEACLGFCAGRLWTWKEVDFQERLCENVIKPLKVNCEHCRLYYGPAPTQK